MINSLLLTPHGMERVRENIEGEFGLEVRWNIHPKNFITDVDGSLDLFRVSSDSAKSCTAYPEIIREKDFLTVTVLGSATLVGSSKI